MKKRAIIIFGLISVILLISLASAQRFEEAGNKIIDLIKQIFGPFFEALIGTNQFDQYFFARVMFLILIYAIIVTVVKRIPIFKGNYFVSVIIAAIVSILGVRYLADSDFVEWILLPYGTLAAAVLVFMPFLIYFFFVHLSVQSGAGRRIAWIVFAVFFMGIWISRINASGSFEFDNLKTIDWIYIAGIIGVVASFFFDNEIQKYFNLHAINTWKQETHNSEISRLQAEYQNILNVDTPHAKHRREQIIQRLKELGANPS